MDRAAFVSSMRDQGIPLALAEREAEKRFPVTPVELQRQERNAAIQEKEEQSEITKRFRVCGFTVRNLSQPRASKQSPGLPDLFITHDTMPAALWWESKRQVRGKYSDAQLAFREDCRRCGITCEGGDRYDAERWLVMHGHARMGGDGKITPTRVVHALEPITEDR